MTDVAVDAHVHVIGDAARYPLHPVALPGDSWYSTAAVDADGLTDLMGEATVARAVLVQAVGAYGDDNSYALDAAAASPDRFAAVCMIDPRAPDPVARLRQCVRDRGAAGVRLFAIRDPANDPIDGPLYQPLWVEATELHLPVVVTVWSSQLAGLVTVLDRYDVPVVVDHCAFPDFEVGPPADALAELFGLSAHPRLSVKATTHLLDSFAAAGHQPADLMRTLVDELGADRVIWGSDFAQTHDRPYPQLVDAGRQAAAGLSDEERANVLRHNAERLWWRPRTPAEPHKKGL
jgi:L-fuconolactonase